MVICLERGASDWHMVQLMPLPPEHLLVYLSHAGLPWLMTVTNLLMSFMVKVLLNLVGRVMGRSIVPPFCFILAGGSVYLCHLVYVYARTWLEVVRKDCEACKL